MLYQGDVATLIDEEKTVKLTVDRIEEAIELLLQSDSLSLEETATTLFI